jgi:Rrf2 family iron-sulfur cluster assembly transcriptional regulator
MIVLPRKAFYAIEAVLYVAYNTAHGPISSKEIADTQGLPARYLEQLMQKLVRAGILRGVRGPRGGYLLARERRRITVADICDVLEGEQEEQLPENITPLGKLVVQPLLAEAREAAMAALRAKTMVDLCDQAAAKAIGKQTGERVDFSI